MFTDAEHVIDAVAASAEDARWLRVRAGVPLLRERRFTTDRAGQPVEWSDDRYLSTETAFSVRNSITVNALSRTPPGRAPRRRLAFTRSGGVVGRVPVWLGREVRGGTPGGASARNFGLVWVSGRRAGPELALALRARELWAEIADGAPGGSGPAWSPTRSLTSRPPPGCEVREAAALPDAKQREFELLGPDEVRSVNPALRGEFLGGLHCRADAIVEPRVALPALRASLAGPSTTGGRGSRRSSSGARRAGLPRHLASGRPGGALHRRQLHRGSRAAPGGVRRAGGLLINEGTPRAEPSGLRRVRLQMLQTLPFDGRLTTSLADGDSLRYYPAYDRRARALPPQAAVAAAPGRSCCWCSGWTGR